MPTYYVAPNDKYPVGQIRLDPENPGQKDRIHYASCDIHIDDKLLLVYGTIGDEINVNTKLDIQGKKAYLLIWKKSKRQWNADTKKWDLIDPDKSESYLYDLIKGKYADAGSPRSFGLKIRPMIPEMFWEEMEKPSAEVDTAYCEKIANATVQIHPLKEDLPDEDIKLLKDLAEKQGGKNSGASWGANKESTSDTLETRKKFLLENMGSYGEGITSLQELVATMGCYESPDKEIASALLEVLLKLM